MRAPDFGLLFDASPGLLLAVTPAQTVVAATDAWLLATATSREEILGRDLSEVLAERAGSTVASPVFGARGELCYVIHRLEAVHGCAPMAAPAPEPEERPLVLVVEDNKLMNRFIRDCLDEENRTCPAFDGAEGLRLAGELRPDLILSDLMMPLMSGDQVLQALRSRPIFDNTPVVLLTSVNDEVLRSRLLREGAQDYIVKPFSGDELRARVGNLIAVKRVREVLQGELESKTRSVAALAHEAVARRRELEHALDSSRVARDVAERASQLKSSFLGMVSHELRTPLTGLRLQIERLQEDDLPEAPPHQRKALDRMAASTQRLSSLIESLLHYARIEGGHLSTEIETFTLGPLVAEVLQDLRPLAESRGLALEVAVEDPLPQLTSDPRLTALILANLVGNAIKFTRRGAVRVAISHAEGLHRLAVTDTGPGIPAEDLLRIFEPFEQVEPSHQKHTPGIGLGLTLVREMATALAGRVEVRSEIGRGSTFTVLLPQVLAAPPAARPA